MRFGKLRACEPAAYKAHRFLAALVAAGSRSYGFRGMVFGTQFPGYGFRDRDLMLVTRHRQDDSRLLARLDPGFWHPEYERVVASCALPLVELGEFITAITYGPIVTGKKPPPCAEGIVVVHQGQVSETGVDPREAVVVAPGSAWDNPRARLQAEDIVLPRSGVASVAKNRVAIFLGDYAAVVGSFVDLVRVRGIDPFYTLICLKTEVVWSQIHRIINGVGTPNISFDEVRSLRVPMLPDEAQVEFRREYLRSVHALHVEWLAGRVEAREEAVRNFGALVGWLNELTMSG